MTAEPAAATDPGTRSGQACVEESGCTEVRLLTKHVEMYQLAAVAAQSAVDDPCGGNLEEGTAGPAGAVVGDKSDSPRVGETEVVGRPPWTTTSA
ncbi:hypothetical protein ACWD3I_24045 [Streptomyces sp. NPDC002817]|uniref:hypothetical protein n=1 Tax=Streptomyces sp. NPDC088357 TaxID=3154655 RepID=UPI00342B89D0